MKKTALLLPLALLLTSLPCAAQGPLAPSGAPGETMHTLEEIHDRTEPRTPISSLPHTITNSGSYYVVANLVSTTNGIVIQASGVTVDLMGFSLTGDGGVDDYGIHVAGATNAMIDKVVIKNGTVSEFYNGLRCDYMNNSRIEQMVVSGNTSHGVYLHGKYGQCDGNTIADCSINGNNAWGIWLYGRYGQCNGNTISDCSISENNNYGVLLWGKDGQCDGNTIANCAVSGNGASGVYLDATDNGQCNGNTIADCSISRNGSGVNLIGENGQCDGNTIANCSISRNGYGVYLGGYNGQCNGNTITDCTINGNNGFGVSLYGDYLNSSGGQCDGNTIRENTISKNTTRGISLDFADGNRVEANHVWGTTGAPSYGIRMLNTMNNFILKNTCVGHTNNFDLDSDDTYGPEVTDSGVLSSAGDESHPWANFSRGEP